MKKQLPRRCFIRNLRIFQFRYFTNHLGRDAAVAPGGSTCIVLNPLGANSTKQSNTLKQKTTNCLSVFDHFVGLALKGLIRSIFIIHIRSIFHCYDPLETSVSLCFSHIFRGQGNGISALNRLRLNGQQNISPYFDVNRQYLSILETGCSSVSYNHLYFYCFYHLIIYLGIQ